MDYFNDRKRHRMQEKPQSDIKQEFLELLKDDEEVSEMLFDVFKKFMKKNTQTKDIDVSRYSSEINSLKAKNRDLINEVQKLENQKNAITSDFQTKIGKLEREVDNYKSKTDTQNQKISNLQNQIKELLKIKDKYNAIGVKFENVLRMYQIYQQLQEKHGTFLGSLFKGNSIEVFFTCGVQRDNIDLLWDYIKDSIIEEKDYIEELKTLFNYFFTLYNKIYDNELFRFSEVNIGDYFDSEKHIKSSASNHSGKISNINFYGYYNTNTDKIIKKTIVKVD